MSRPFLLPWASLLILIATGAWAIIHNSADQNGWFQLLAGISMLAMILFYEWFHHRKERAHEKSLVYAARLLDDYRREISLGDNPQRATNTALRMLLYASYWFIGAQAMVMMIQGPFGENTNVQSHIIIYIVYLIFYILIAAFCLRGLKSLRFACEEGYTKQRKAEFERSFEKLLLELGVPITSRNGELNVQQRIERLDGNEDPLADLRLPSDHPALKRTRIVEWFLDQ